MFACHRPFQCLILFEQLLELIFNLNCLGLQCSHVLLYGHKLCLKILLHFVLLLLQEFLLIIEVVVLSMEECWVLLLQEGDLLEGCLPLFLLLGKLFLQLGHQLLKARSLLLLCGLTVGGAALCSSCIAAL